MDVLDDEILQLWKLFHKHQVKYILVGGFATNLHGFQRYTGDIDIWMKDELENRKKLRQVLKEMEIGDFPAIETMEFIAGWTTISLASGFELDIMSALSGFQQKDFDFCLKNASVATITDIPVPFLHINQLIQEKKSTGRTKDLLDIEELEKIKKLRSNKP